MNETCTVYTTMNLISKKWSLVILLEIYKGTNGKKRFSELKNSLPDITSKILSIRLKELEKQGLIYKKIHTAHVPVKCEYSLTKRGKEFVEIIKQIKKWALKWYIDNPVCEHLNCTNCE